MLRPRPILTLLLGLALAVAASAEPGSEPTGVAGAAPAAEVGADPAAEPGAEQLAAWLAAGRALRQREPGFFAGAEGVLVTRVLPDTQGAAAGLVPGDVLIRYGGRGRDAGQGLVALTGETPADQPVRLRWLRPRPDGTAEAMEAELLDAGWAARHRADYPGALPTCPAPRGAGDRRPKYPAMLDYLHTGAVPPGGP